MPAGGEHLRWKAEHLSAVHTLENTDRLVRETLAIVREASDAP